MEWSVSVENKDDKERRTAEDKMGWAVFTDDYSVSQHDSAYSAREHSYFFRSYWKSFEN